MYDNTYDKILSATIENILYLSKDNGKIIIEHFNPNDENYMYMLNAARVSLLNMDRSRKIYLDMGLIPYLWFKFRHKDICEFQRYTKKEENDRPIKVENMILFMTTEFNVNIDTCKDIYKKYYA